jgi:phage protein D
VEALNGVPHPVWDLRLAGKVITRDLAKYVLSVTYEDHEEGEADTVDVAVEDVEGKFRGDWYPTKGDSLSLRIGYEGSPLVSCGEFEVDEITLAGVPDVVTIRAVSAGVTKPRRTRQGKAYENTSLRAIAEAVAKRAKLTVVGTIEPIAIRRTTQIYENDLEFLRRVAGEYGYAFSVKGNQLVFIKRADLAQVKAAITLARTDIRPYSFRDKIKDVVAQADATHHDPKTKSLKRAQATGATDEEVSGDTLKINVRAETPAQAKAKAGAAIEAANREATTCEGTTFGDPRLVAGINVTLEGFGALSGVYHIKRSRHTLDRSGGYRTEFEARRVARG